MPHEYLFEGNSILRRRRIEEAHITLTLRAEGTHMERTGVHARVTILAENSVLAWSSFNIERDEDRVRLTNSAYKHLDSVKQVYPSNYLKADLDNFCYGLWDAQVGQLMPQWMELPAVRTEPGFALRPWILDGGGTIVYAPPGRGKSITLYLMDISLDAGVQTLWPVQQRKTLLINLERSPQSVGARLANVNEVLGLDRLRRPLVQNARGKSLSDVITAAQRAIVDEGIEVVFLDSISRAGLGDLNANEAVNRIIDNLNGLCSTWVALAHTPRGSEDHIYGGVHFEAGADITVKLLSQQEEDGPLGVGLQVDKQNDVGKQPLWIMALEFDAAGLTGVRRAHAGEFPDIEAFRKVTMKEAIRQHLLDVGPSDATEIAAELGYNRSNVANLLTTDQGTFVKGGKVGRRQLYAVRA